MSLIQMSIWGGFMAGAVGLFRFLFRGKISGKFFTLLWLLAALRLLLPFSIPSQVSIYTLFSSSVPESGEWSDTRTWLFPAMAKEEDIRGEKPGHVAQSWFPEGQEADGGKRFSGGSEPGRKEPGRIWTGVWFLGCMACICFFLRSWRRCRREFDMSLPVENEYVRSWLKAHPLWRPISVRQCSCVPAPLTYGIFRPVILMGPSTQWRESEELGFVLEHEYVHIRRFDAVMKLLLTTAFCVHWFNPLVWGMYILAERDMELSCDEAVVRRFGGKAGKAYALTLISMEEKKSGMAPLCSGFGKSALEERIIAIMRTGRRSVSVSCLAVLLTLGMGFFFTAPVLAEGRGEISGPDEGNQTRDQTFLWEKKRTGERQLPGGFTQEDQERLLALRPEGFRDMTVGAYQEWVWEKTDTPGFRSLLDRFSESEELYEQKEKYEAASFFYDLLAPLMAEKWQRHGFGGYASTTFSDASDQAVLEYWMELTILDREGLTVGEYENTRISVDEELKAFFLGKNQAELQNEKRMTDAVNERIRRLTQKLSTDALQVSIEYAYMPLMMAEEAGQYKNPAEDMEGEREKRDIPYGTREDYDSLLRLRTPDYGSMSLAEFNDLFLDWCNEDHERMERIGMDMFRQDQTVSLTEEELRFAGLTASLSREENYRKITAIQTGKPEEDPCMSMGRRQKQNNGTGAWCTLDVRFSWHVADAGQVTVEERDRCVGTLTEKIEQFWEETPLSSLIRMEKAQVTALFRNYAEECGGKGITLHVDENMIHFEHRGA